MAVDGTLVRLAEVSPVAWTSERELALSDWILQGRRIGTVSRGAQWWLGDWLMYGNRHYGDTYIKAAKITTYDIQSLMNMVYVASRFEISRRRENVSWSHHATLAALGPENQELWLDRVVADRLSVGCLRTELRAWARDGSAREPAEVSGSGARAAPVAILPPSVCCPACGHTFEAP